MGKLYCPPAVGGRVRGPGGDAPRERASTLVELAQISAFYYRDFESFDKKAAKKALKAGALEPLAMVRSRLAELKDWNREDIHQVIDSTVKTLELGFGKVAMPVRVAVTGGSPSPDLDLTMEMIGQAACLRRLDKAIEYIQKQS
jgi:glutamyl-tRNA synthetase